MSAIIQPRDLEFGDAVLNFGDSIYKDSPDRRAQDNVLRLCAYLLFSNRVGLPTRHLMQNGNMFTLLEWMPELLQDGLVFVDVPHGNTSVVQSISAANYSDDANEEEAQERAEFIDQNSKLLHAFDATGMMARFREQFLKDVSDRGAFRRMASKRKSMEFCETSLLEKS